MVENGTLQSMHFVFEPLAICARLMKFKTYISLPCRPVHVLQIVLARGKNSCSSRLINFFTYSRRTLLTLCFFFASFFFLGSVDAGFVGSVCEVLLREMWIDGMLCLGCKKNYSSNKHLSDYTSNIENVVSICNHTPAMGRKADVGLHLLLICLRFSRNITIISKDKTHVP